MTLAKFWEIIGAIGQSGDCQSYAERLREQLLALSPDDIVEFQTRFNELLYQSYTAELWGAAHLLNGGCSDSNFHYFRAWLIGQGKDVFEAALANPDSLSQLEADEELMCEELLYVAYSVYREVAGREMELGQLPLPELAAEWDFNDPAEMEVRYPRLSGLFGEFYAFGDSSMADAMLQKCRARYNQMIDRVGLWDKMTYLHLPKPLWLHWNDTDKLHGFYYAAPKLFDTGQIVWGHIVQANSQLFEKGTSNCPAQMVYSLDPLLDSNPELLMLVAERLFDLKGTKPADSELAPFAERITDEYSREFGWEVPAKLSGKVPCLVSVTMIFRKHLPNSILSKGLMPILTDPNNPQAALILPSRFWPPELVSWWLIEE